MPIARFTRKALRSILIVTFSVAGLGAGETQASCDPSRGTCTSRPEAWAYMVPNSADWCPLYGVPGPRSYTLNESDVAAGGVSGRVTAAYKCNGETVASSSIIWITACPSNTTWDATAHICADPTYDPIKNIGPEVCALPKASNFCGNPINIAVGNKYQVETDFSFSPLLEFARYYNSQDTGPTRFLGSRWGHTYARSVEYVGADPTLAIVSRPQGTRITFRATNGQWVPDADVAATLVRVEDSQGQLLGWTYSTRDGREVEQYDALGRLIQITTDSGASITLTFNNGVIENNANDRRLTRVASQDGRTLLFAYGATGSINTITDATGAVYTFTYDLKGNLTAVSYPGGGSRTYLYNEPAYTSDTYLPHALTGIVDEGGQRYATFRYDSGGRAISTEHAGGVDKFSAQYNTDGSSTVTTPLGNSQQRAFTTVLGVKKPLSVVETCVDCGQ